MTFSTSNPSSTVKPLSAAEKAAWAAQNRAEELDRRNRFGRMSFAQKLQALESQGRMLSMLRERQASPKPKPVE